MNHSIFVDRIEGDTAVLMTDDGDRVDVPKSMLPPGVGEGHWLNLSLAPDPGRTAAMAGKTRALRAKLAQDDDGGDISL